MKGSLRDDSILVAILRANKERDPRLVRLKIRRMSTDAFAYFRGTCHRFVSTWSELRPAEPGPEILACGDLHVENFGAYRDDEGEYLYDVNDFDEAARAPCGVDTVRCATSILLAAENWSLTPLHSNGLVLAYLDHYRSAVTIAAASRLVEAAAPRIERGPVWDLVGKTALGSQGELLDRHTERIKDGTRRIAREKRRHPELEPDRRGTIMNAVEAYGQAQEQPEFYRPIDATARIAGVGSLGVERYLVLVAGGGSNETNQLFDIKECLPSAWSTQDGQIGDSAREARRVVDAQSQLQCRPTAGLNVIAIGPKSYRIREMIPEENRSQLDRFRKKRRKLFAAIETAGLLTGLAHLRGAQAGSGKGPDAVEPLKSWANGAALDSLLACAARYAERTRLEFKQFLEELRVPEAPPEDLREILDA